MLQRWIVIVVVGIVLVSLIGLAVNPLEQIRRAQDRRVEEDAREFLEAVEHYYKVFFEYPWEALGEDAPDGVVAKSSWLEELSSKRIISADFVDRFPGNQIYVTQTETTTVYACFDPVSRQFQTGADRQGRNRNGASGCLTGCWTCWASE